jgi:hypothetical protein
VEGVVDDDGKKSYIIDQKAVYVLMFCKYEATAIQDVKRTQSSFLFSVIRYSSWILTNMVEILYYLMLMVLLFTPFLYRYFVYSK